MSIFSELAHDLVVIRHGQTDWNAARRLQGREDIPLNDTGRNQARRNGERLKARFETAGIDPACWDFVASPLARAAETMALVREAMGLDPLAFRRDERLVELDFGRWSGLHLDEVARADPKGWHEREADRWMVPPPDGESHEMAVARITAVVEELSRPTVIVTHGGVNRVLKVLLGALDRATATGFHTPQDRFYSWSGGAVEWH